MKSEDYLINLTCKVIFLALIGPGTGGNSFLIVKHVYMAITDFQKKPTNLILIQLAFANMLIICAVGITDRSVFPFSGFLGSVGCKTVVYLGRVARGLSICTSCLLSMVQAVTISPRTMLWGNLKPRTSWQILPYLLLCWIINFLISSNLLHYVTSVSSMNRSVIGMHAGYCYFLPSRQIIRWLFLSLMALRDVIFQCLMGWSSGHMAFCLYEHHKLVLYLHSSRMAKNSSPEIRATLSTLILMTCFLFFYWADFIFSFYIGSMVTHDFTILNIKKFLGLGYTVLSPLVLISRDAHMVKCWHGH
ncbi:putative vomeronasal receptor-like protein 4 [Fukomys damarensis]|uniref:putative vomeronasal receptor-like protein 4 n=1 Tax=Fukomys damarensis TaxID=885580 RepID=UPI0008FED202|nr:putative vomeronasal receptor-like protein 4 [Fukomys damarensis]